MQARPKNTPALMGSPKTRVPTSVPQNALLAAGLVLLSTVAPYILYTKGLANVESGKASIMASIEPVVGTLVGTLVFGEPISAGVFLGLACILACVYILR